MSVYFVYRSPYDNPTGKFVRRFDDTSVLAWFQIRWEGAKEAEDTYDYARSLVGCSVYGFGSLFECIKECDLPCPRSDRELARVLKEHLYAEGEILARPNVIQVLTDDDELELAYYFFDDTFLAKHGDRAAYLLQKATALPAAGKEAPTATARARTRRLKLSGEHGGVTYLAFLTFYDSCALSDLEGAYRIEGVRVPELMAYLQIRTLRGDVPFEIRLMQAQARAYTDVANLEALWQRLGRLSLRNLSDAYDTAVYTQSDPVRGHQILAAAVPGEGPGSALSQVQAGSHLAQLCLHVDTWGKQPLFHQWIVFDDLWLAANPALGNAILRYAAQWDVLTGSGR